MTVRRGHGHVDGLATPSGVRREIQREHPGRGIGDLHGRLLLDRDPEVLDAHGHFKSPVFKTVVGDVSGPDVIVYGVVALKA